jgi:hypothetical protein
MALQYSDAVRNARLDVVESTTGATAKLYLYSGSVTANCAAADPSGLLATLTLPSDWMAAASGGTKAIANGPWTGTGSAAGSAASFRIKDNAGTTCHIQGTVTATGGGGDMTLNNVVIANGQTINVTSFTLTAGNA